jgi:formylglycine-generating enzyme required for sulfatase activity
MEVTVQRTDCAWIPASTLIEAVAARFLSEYFSLKINNSLRREFSTGVDRSRFYHYEPGCKKPTPYVYLVDLINHSRMAQMTVSQYIINFNKTKNLKALLFGVLFSSVAMALSQPKIESPLFPHFRDCDVCSEIIVLPGGRYLMGASDEEFQGQDKYRFMYGLETPQHEVEVTSFGIAKFDVTRRQFAIFAKEAGFDGKGCKIFNGRKWIFNSSANWENPGFKQTERDPVVCVSWNDANEFIKWLNRKTVSKKFGSYRLPTEAEWEYAARAGMVTSTYWGDDRSRQCDFENARDLSASSLGPEVEAAHCNDSYSETAPVGSFKPNPWGLYDMLGNVSKWVSDCWYLNYSDNIRNLLSSMPNSCGHKTIRGAGWAMIPITVRSAYRSGESSDMRLSTLGFRLAVDFKK